MGARYVFIVSISVGLLAGNESAQAQDTPSTGPGTVQALPPIVVSGTIFFPAGPAPRGGRNVIAWAHPTTGVVRRCAPTLLPDLSGTVAGLDDIKDLIRSRKPVDAGKLANPDVALDQLGG